MALFAAAAAATVAAVAPRLPEATEERCGGASAADSSEMMFGVKVRGKRRWSEEMI